MRSATLDTWLPEQVAFIQCKHHSSFLFSHSCNYIKSLIRLSRVLKLNLALWFFAAMGNEKSNSYWEAEIPPNYDRVGIENFIRAKYDLIE